MMWKMSPGFMVRRPQLGFLGNIFAVFMAFIEPIKGLPGDAHFH